MLGLPRGGVPVAAGVAAALTGELDVLVVRKLGAPGQPELALGAVAAGVRVRNDDLLRQLRVEDHVLAALTARELGEVERRERVLRGDRPRPTVQGRTVVLVDDGLATGATLLAAVRAVRQLRPALLLAAVPVGAPDAVARIRPAADAVVCLHVPRHLRAVGEHYADFTQTGDEQVRALLGT